MSPQQWHDLFHIGDLRAAYQIADRVKDRVLIDRLGPVALAVAEHVRGNDMEARLSQRVDLAAPGVRDFREAVAEQNKRALTLLDDIQADAIGLDDPLVWFAHRPRPSRSTSDMPLAPHTTHTKAGV